MTFLPAFSFRIKLLLAMMIVVVGVVGATLYVTEQRVRATYQAMFEKQFESEIGFFNAMQETRLSHVKDRCVSLAKSVRLIAAMDAATKEPGQIANTYLVAHNELRDVIRTDANDRRALPATYFRLFDAAGKELPPPGDRLRSLKKKAQTKTAKGHGTEDFSDISSKLFAESASQQAGYLTPQIDSTNIELIEVVYTKIIDPAESRLVGAMVLGFPLFAASEKSMEKVANIKSGIWFNDELHSRTIPKEWTGPLAEQVSERLAGTNCVKGSFSMEVGNEPQRVFFQALNPGSAFPTAYQICLYSTADQIADLKALRLKVGLFGGVALLGALMLSLLISHNFSVPIRQLVEGTAQIQQGNFSVKVPVQTRDEIGRLAQSFNEMAEGLALKEKYHSVLNMVTDKEVAEQLMKGNVDLGGELREISVIFCDIRGFTALTQNMDPAEVIHLLNEHMTALTRVVYEHNGVVDKFVGDLIMAVFGAPKSYGNDAHNAARCALRMIQDRQKLNETSQYKIEVGIGIATGQAVAGCMGSNDRLNYTVLGERVNLGSRLCSQAGRMEVVIDQTTREKLGELVQVESKPDLKLKGFTEAVSAYKLLEVRSLPAS